MELGALRLSVRRRARHPRNALRTAAWARGRITAEESRERAVWTEVALFEAEHRESSASKANRRANVRKLQVNWFKIIRELYILFFHESRSP